MDPKRHGAYSRPGHKLDWSQYPIECLKLALTKRGLGTTGTREQVLSRLMEDINNESFALFPRLPREIQDLIWGFALPARRFVAPFYKEGVSLTAVRNVMVACKAASEVVLSRYQGPLETRVSGQRFSIYDDILELQDELLWPRSPTKPIRLRDQPYHSTFRAISAWKNTFHAIGVWEENLNKSIHPCPNAGSWAGLMAYGMLEITRSFQHLKLIVLTEYPLRIYPIPTNRCLGKNYEDAWGVICRPKFHPFHPRWLNESTDIAPNETMAKALAEYRKAVAEDERFYHLQNVKIVFVQSQDELPHSTPALPAPEPLT